MTLRYDWRQAGSTGRAHLVAHRLYGRSHYSMSACGVVRLAAWMPAGDAVPCGLCRRLAAQAERRGDLMVSRDNTKELA